MNIVRLMWLIQRIKDSRQAVVDDYHRRVNEYLVPFQYDLDAFLATLFRGVLPDDWRAQWHAFVAEAATKGFPVEPASVREHEAWIESHARFCGLLPRGVQTVSAPGRQSAETLPDGGFVITVTPDVSGPPEDGVDPTEEPELAGEGPVTRSFRDKVQFLLEALDPDVAVWWKSSPVRAQLVGRDATSWSWLRLLRKNFYSEGKRHRPVVVYVDMNFTAADAALAIISEAYNLDDASAGASFRKYMAGRKGAVDVIPQWKRDAVAQGAQEAAMLAEIYYGGLASVTVGGDLVVTVNDVSEQGFHWRQFFVLLPFVSVVFGRVKSIRLRIVKKGSNTAREIKIPVELGGKLQKLDAKARRALITKATKAKTETEALEILETGVAAGRAVARAKPPKLASRPTTAATGRGKKAPRSAPKKVPGKWFKKNESMSSRARDYQKQITGRTGQVYKIGETEYDGLAGGTLLEAKGPGYSSFVKGTKFKKWFANEGQLLRQARAQARSAPGVALEWHVAEADVADTLRALFTKKRIVGIKVIHTPPK